MFALPMHIAHVPSLSQVGRSHLQFKQSEQYFKLSVLGVALNPYIPGKRKNTTNTSDFLTLCNIFMVVYSLFAGRFSGWTRERQAESNKYISVLLVAYHMKIIKH